MATSGDDVVDGPPVTSRENWIPPDNQLGLTPSDKGYPSPGPTAPDDLPVP